jgi:hypothetical protein
VDLAPKNISYFRDRLERETDPWTRSRLRKLLIEEEDKLGHNSKALDTIETHITTGRMRVERQRSLVASMERDGYDTTRARAVLSVLNDTLLIFEDHRKSILIALKQSRI